MPNYAMSMCLVTAFRNTTLALVHCCDIIRSDLIRVPVQAEIVL